VKNEDGPQNFKSHAQSADKFWQLIESGTEYRNRAKYEQALEKFQEAYDVYAVGNIEKPIALVHAAETHELMHQYEKASILFEEASQITMHETNKKKYMTKALALRQKF